MKTYNFDITQLKINEEVHFTLPYLDGKLKFKGTVISVKTNGLTVEYKTCVGEIISYKTTVFTTEIPFSFLIK